MADQHQAAISGKAFHDLAARFALAGWQLWRSDAADGPQRLFTARWGRLHVLASAEEAEDFLSKVAGVPA